MNRIQRLRSVEIEYREDIATIRRNISELSEVSDADIQELYRQWSEDTCYASWQVALHNLSGFRD